MYELSQEIGSKLQSLKNFLMVPDSEESKNYISDILSGETARPEELFVQKFLNVEFWKELGFQDSELKFERPAGVSGRVEWTLKIEGKMIAIECKRPFLVKKDREVKNELDGSDIKELEDQISRYLLSHEFIIFTNGFYWYFYSRESYSAWLANKKKKNNKINPYFFHLESDEIFDEKSSNYITNFLGRENILEALSLMENKSIRHVITDDFFKDLKSWVGFIDSALKDSPSDVKARTTSLINKLIFVRTMEGTGVIQNDFLQSIWKTKKGGNLPVVKFVDQIDEGLSDTYDTELFTSTYIEDKDGKLVRDKNNQPIFNPARAKNLVIPTHLEQVLQAILSTFQRYSHLCC